MFNISMSEEKENNNKKNNVIDLFKHQSKSDIEFSNSQVEKVKKGGLSLDFPYIKLTKDTNGNYFSKELLREYSKKVYYIVSIMRDNPPSCALYKYKVAQSSLLDFLNTLNEKISDGEIIDIEKYIPEDLA